MNEGVDLLLSRFFLENFWLKYGKNDLDQM